MATGKIEGHAWTSCGTATGTTTAQLTDFTKYNEFYIQLYYSGYVVSFIIPRKAFASAERTLTVSYSTTSNVPFWGTIKYAAGSVRLATLYDYQNTDITASAQIDILGHR